MYFWIVCILLTYKSELFENYWCFDTFISFNDKSVNDKLIYQKVN